MDSLLIGFYFFGLAVSGFLALSALYFLIWVGVAK
jgi:hypothetical protein